MNLAEFMNFLMIQYGSNGYILGVYCGLVMRSPFYWGYFVEVKEEFR